MNGVFFQRIQAIVRRHMWLLLPGMALTCGGCISCTGHRMTTFREHVDVQLTEEQAAKVQPYVMSKTPIPGGLCDELCKSAAGSRRNPTCFLPSSEVAPEPVGSEPASHHLTCAYTVNQVMIGGRRPSGLQAVSAHERPAIGAWLAEMARLEAASIVAFAELHDELARLGAPAALRDACIVSTAEECRHADLMQQLARASDSEPAPPIIKTGPRRSLFELACENAVEGCVREAFGALEALWQSHTARDEALRRAMAEIAEDEARHAELSFALHDWLHPRLTATERQHVARVRRDAEEAMWRDLGARHGTASGLGLPLGMIGQVLFHEMMNARCQNVRSA